jgi:hypothetical protein
VRFFILQLCNDTRAYFNQIFVFSSGRTRVCSAHFLPGQVIQTPDRPDRLNPRADPHIDIAKFPLVKSEVMKSTTASKAKDPQVHNIHVKVDV